MPTSNGLVTARDIRQAAVKTLHIRDDAVVTAKIPDLAVTYPDKIDNPFWVTAWETPPWSNQSITSTSTEFTSVAIDIPAWIDQVSILAIATLQISNFDGANRNFSVYVTIDGNATGGRVITVANNETGAMEDLEIRNLIGVAGGTVTIAVNAAASSGTHTTNLGRAWGMAVGTRE